LVKGLNKVPAEARGIKAQQASPSQLKECH
jgi:hypothetical protein